MNRIIREHYPVSKLPEDVQSEFDGQGEVTLIVESTAPPERQPPTHSDALSDDAALAQLRREPVRGGDFSRFKHLRRKHFGSSAEAEAHIEALRNDWVHRER